MASSPDWVVVGIVILARLVLPLFIPKYPLPAIIACLIVDGVDQTIFQTFTRLNLDWYQSYDKALDIYYQVIAYLSTQRNWRNHPAFRISRFLLYYRLIGVAAFEITQWRPLLLIFPNTFEYFFIYYESLRTRWNPMRFTRRYWVVVAAAIWVFIKLPQEWWIHIAQFDTTDLIKDDLFGVSLATPFMAAVASRPWVAVAAAVLVILLALAIRFLLIPRLPAPHHGWELAAEPLPRRADSPEERRQIFVRTRQPIDQALLEKVVLVTLVTLIFAQILGQTLPNFRGTNLQLVLAVIAIIVLNSFVSDWFAHHGIGWRSAVAQFAALGLVNAAILLTAHFLFAAGPIWNAGPSAFLLAQLTLLITLYDYFRPAYSARFETRGRGGGKVATS